MFHFTEPNSKLITLVEHKTRKASLVLTAKTARRLNQYPPSNPCKVLSNKSVDFYSQFNNFAKSTGNKTSFNLLDIIGNSHSFPHSKKIWRTRRNPRYSFAKKLGEHSFRNSNGSSGCPFLSFFWTYEHCVIGSCCLSCSLIQHSSAR